jgi:hypothetical protein
MINVRQEREGVISARSMEEAKDANKRVVKV